MIVESSHSFVNNDTFSDGIVDPWDPDLKVISWKESSSSYSSKKLREALKFMWRSSGGLPWKRHWILSMARYQNLAQY